ncbi:MAG: CAP domain-containing protein [Jatrophihabitantaceae bacterium]
MPSRLAPALGLTAAFAMLSAVGIIAIENSNTSQQRPGLAGAVLLPSTGGPSGNVSGPTSSADSLAAAPIASQPSSHAGPTAATSATASQPGQTSQARQSTGPQSFAQAVFLAVNRARAAQHLMPLGWDPRLRQSAHAHNRAMAAANTLTHQVESEPSLGSRETAAGVQWTFAAENIGWTTERSLAGVLDIETRMLAETAPNDAHRRNILARSAQTMGVDVYLDLAHGRLWLTEDFAGNS